MANIKINNVDLEVPNETTILEAARKVGVQIPTLCHLDMHDIKMVNKVGTCRVCMVEIEGRHNLMPACTTEIFDGMSIHTNSRRAVNARRTNMELLLSNHPPDCLKCERNLSCELQRIAGQMGIHENPYEGSRVRVEKDKSSYSLVKNMEKCVLCRRCETMCNEVQAVGVYSTVHRGFETVMGSAFELPMIDTACTFCGQCVSVCPTGALTEVNETANVWAAISDPDKFVVVQTAPAIRAALGEAFGMPAGTLVTGKMVTALRRMGFDKVMDTDFAADLTIMEEAQEFLNRLEGKGRIPILTSCCPAWVKFIEHQFPDLLDIPSTCRSPNEMFGSIAKTYLAKKLNIDPAKMVVVSVMPCLAKKYEARRDELKSKDKSNIDYVITTRELAAMIRESGMNFAALPDGDFDKMMGESTGAGVIFGTTGGVIEAAVRTAAYWLDGKMPDKIDFTELRGLEGIRQAEVSVGGKPIKIAIAHGLGNAKKLLEDVRDGKVDVHAIEIMACPLGCIGGGGQPFHNSNFSILQKRANAIYEEDKGKAIRVSCENPEIIELYKDFLGERGGHLAHELLHTTYTKREKI
ncbi:MAG: NADH-dependent [FeFe] hydrogenase, group A6 [Turicibacter sp.]|nr:NADH-dependent [FeFe] hydrogenase, group A6 [Turicibacter sp.]